MTIAIAAGATLLRFEATLSPKADPQLAEEAAGVGRGVRPTCWSAWLRCTDR